MVADISLEGGQYRWPGGPVARTNYPTLMYAGECDPPLGVGSGIKLGRLKLVVVAEEPDTATVLVRRRGPWGWLRWAGWEVTERFRDNGA
jgi:hypothetical protein